MEYGFAQGDLEAVLICSFEDYFTSKNISNKSKQLLSNMEEK